MIERAKGIVMRLSAVSEEEAYRRMRRTATDEGKKLAEAAGVILCSGHAIELLVGDNGQKRPPSKPK